MITVRHPGKLYVLGEYSVMNPGHSAVLVPVKQMMVGSIEEASKTAIHTRYGSFYPDGDIHPDLNYVQAAYRVASDYLEHLGRSCKSFNLDIKSDLDTDGLKYGFGSSGVIVVTVLDAMFKFHQVDLPRLTLFKLAVITQYRMGDLSSGGDLAIAVFGAPLIYTRYALDNLSKKVSAADLDWRQLDIRPIKLPFKLAVGWTQSPYKTKDALNRTGWMQANYPVDYEGFLDHADAIVKQFIDNPEDVLCIRAYREWMQSFQTWTGQVIETPQLKQLIKIASDLGFEAKVSGAGGGDCGIAVTHGDISELVKLWNDAGIIAIEI